MRVNGESVFVGHLAPPAGMSRVSHRKQLSHNEWELQKWRMTANLWTIKHIWKFLATQTGRILFVH